METRCERGIKFCFRKYYVMTATILSCFGMMQTAVIGSGGGKNWLPTLVTVLSVLPGRPKDYIPLRDLHTPPTMA